MKNFDDEKITKNITNCYFQVFYFLTGVFFYRCFQNETKKIF